MISQTQQSLGCSWLNLAENQISELAKLPENWDGYNSRPIQPATIEQAHSFLFKLVNLHLPQPDIFPVPGGGIQFEFQSQTRELEIEILPDGQIEFLTIEDGQMTEGSFHINSSTDLYRLAHWLRGETLVMA